MHAPLKTVLLFFYSFHEKVECGEVFQFFTLNFYSDRPFLKSMAFQSSKNSSQGFAKTWWKLDSYVLK